MTWKSFLLVLFALGVVACQTAGYKNTATQPVDRSYKATGLVLTVSGDSRGQCQITVHTKMFNDSGMLGICGFILYAGEVGCIDGFSSQSFIDEFFERATLHLNDEAITKAGFLTIRGVETTADTVQATCVRTSKPWDAPYANARVSFKGDPYNQYERY
ncbi:MAG: hypothetical protein OXT06_19595 [Rhodospirillaceae bacterium]|nr:hypothetical protein [Rhodospirillaceae bacterium]MDD9915017.1 hypothetical protein [Rhodospirillaceae bacterium]MDD9926821.1 hypothetical protein [Rhodospirillaceae bacterium]